MPFRYNYPSQVTAHINVWHEELPVNYNVLEEENQHIKDILKKYMAELQEDGTYGEVVTKDWKRKTTPTKATATSTETSAATSLEFADENDLLVVQKVVPTTEKKRSTVNTVKHVARKSTAKPGIDYGWSFYGTKPDYSDLKKVTTTFQINNADVTRTVEQFSHIFNLFPKVLVEDCMKKSNHPRNDDDI